MEEKPRNLRAMLAEAKDLSELMVDLGYASVYFRDPGMATEVGELEARMSELVQDMRATCVLAVRHPRDAKGMSSVLAVISAIERIANDAVDIARIVTHKLGIPGGLVADLSVAEEVSHRVWVREGSAMARQSLAALELPTAVGMRVMAVRRDRTWLTDTATEIDGELILLPDDVVFLRGSPSGIATLHELAAAPSWVPPVVDEAEGRLSDLDRAVDLLVEMKNLSEVAVGLAYSSLVLGDRRLAAEVRHLEHRLDEMNDQLELWVLRAAGSRDTELAPLRGLLHLSQATSDIGDQANQMVWLIEHGEDVHPILELALGDARDVVMQVPVAPGCAVADHNLAALALDIEPGFQVLAVRRGGRYLYRPSGRVVLLVDDDVLLTGPEEGRDVLANRFGWTLVRDEESGNDLLEPLFP